MSDWNADLYLKFKAQRTQPSKDLVNRIQVDHPSRIIDIGCGPGNSTAQLKKKFPEAYILGVDYSPNMIETAKKNYPDMDFMLFDAAKDFDKLDGKFDVVFSNACIQWVPNHEKLLSDMMHILNPGGVLAVQLPVNYEEPIHTIVQRLAKSEKWRSKIGGKREFYTLKDEEYFNILSDISSEHEVWRTIYFHSMPSHQSIIEWYSSTGLKPYLDALDEKDREEFIAQIYTELEQAYRTENCGRIIFKFPRLFFTAKK